LGKWAVSGRQKTTVRKEKIKKIRKQRKKAGLTSRDEAV